MWATVFGVANVVAMIMWATLAFLPRKPALLSLVLYAGVGLLCMAYAFGIIGLLTGAFAAGGADTGDGSFGSIEGVRALFATDGGLTIGWVHYLAFDLFVGLWIARDADAKEFSRIVQIPVLFLTFMAGPTGLLIWLAVREKRARKLGRPQ